jgi:hypothetical protein
MNNYFLLSPINCFLLLTFVAKMFSSHTLLSTRLSNLKALRQSPWEQEEKLDYSRREGLGYTIHNHKMKYQVPLFR